MTDVRSAGPVKIFRPYLDIQHISKLYDFLVMSNYTIDGMMSLEENISKYKRGFFKIKTRQRSDVIDPITW